RLRAGEVLEEVAEALGRDDAQVEAEALLRDDGRLRRALRRDVDDPRERAERGDQRRRVGGGCDDVEVAEGLAEAPRRTGERDAFRRGVGLERSDGRAELRERVPQEDPAGARGS